MRDAAWPPRQAVLTTAAPKPIGAYSQAVAAGPFVFVSGMVGFDAETNRLPETVEDQTRQVMANLAAVLAAAGCTFGDVVKTTVFLADMGDFNAVNAIYGESFDGQPAPARSTVQAAALPRAARIEIDAIAMRK